MAVPLLDVNAQNHPLAAELKQVFGDVLESGRFILGEEVEAFERECAAALGAKHAISISSGTDALIVALMALGIGPGDEVLCPSFTFFATAGSVHRTGATPVFCDVCPVSFGIDLESAKAKLTPRTRAIMPVHLFGQSVDMDAVLAFAAEHGLKVVEDVAQSFGATFRGRTCGTLGEFGCYSFFPSKNLGGFGDGGLVTTESDELATLVLRLRNHGMHPKYHHSTVGGNFRMDALQCALLRVKLRHIGSYETGRARNAGWYAERLAALPGATGIVLPVALPERGHVWNQFTLRVPGRRDALKAHLTEKGIGCEIYYPIPLHRQECFAGLPPHALADCPVSDQLAAEVLSIPVYAELRQAQLDEVAAALESFPSTDPHPTPAQMLKTFITGHRGMVGSALVRHAEKTGRHQLLTAGRDRLDLTDQKAVFDFLAAEKPEIVVIAAAKVGGIHANSTYPADFIYENLSIASNLVEGSRRAGVARVLFLGSSCIYPKMAPQPMTEDCLLTSPLEVTNEAYAIAKIAGLKLCQHYRAQHGLLYHSAMPTNLYGPGDNYHAENSHVIPALIRRFHEAKENAAPSVTIWGTGTPRREFLHVDDLADACFHLLDLDSPPDWVNVGTGEDLTIRDLAGLVAETVGYTGEILTDPTKPDGTPRKLMDISKIKGTGWTPAVDFRDGLAGAYRDFLSSLESGAARL